jgi:hypothetical protein
MSTLTNDTNASNVDSASDALKATEAEQNKMDTYKASESKLVDLAITTLDPKDMLKKYAKMGKEVIGLANIRKESLAIGSWNGQKDFDKVCDDLETLVRMRVPIKDIRMSLYARVYLFVKAVKSLCPNVDELSYYQVANKFVPTLSFDAVDLTAEIKKEWLTWLRLTVDQQLSDHPMSMKELDESIKERKTEIERERAAKSKRTPEQILEAEQKAANRKLIKERTDAQTKIANTVADALSEKTADVNDVVKIVKDVVEQAGLEMPSRLVGFDPANCTVDDCKTLAKAMFHADKLVEMKALFSMLGVLIKQKENSLIDTLAG